MEVVPLQSMSIYMADPKTRVVEYNGRRLVSFISQEGFSGERIARLPPHELVLAARHPITSSLLPCRAGYFPRALHHGVTRPQGDWSHVLLLCLEGSGWIDFGGIRHEVGPGSLALLPPFEFHSYHAHPGDPWSLYWVHFNGRMAGDYHNELTRSGAWVCQQVHIDAHLIQSFERILNIYARGVSRRVLVQAAGCLHQLLSDLINPHEDPGGGESIRTRIERITQVMQAHRDSHLTMHEFAAAAHLSPMYFAAKFREVTGCSPQKYFLKLKMERACELLQTTNWKIEQVAHDVGFADAYYFCRAFKRIIGLTPTSYRRAGPSPVSPGPSRHQPADL